MRWLFMFALTLHACLSNAQDIKVFLEKQDRSVTIYASNSMIIPASVSLDFTLTNMNFSEGDKKIFIVPAKSDKFKLGTLDVAVSTKTNKYSYKYGIADGDVTMQPDRNYIYDLPFRTGKSFTVFQGYNGTISHQNENSLDFTMPESTEIVAARDGLVVKVVQENTLSCGTKDCQQYNNYVRIYHSDGSFANYLHIKFNGARVKTGDVVKKGDLIALSGNTGWSTGPHLHFMAYKADFGKWNSIETKFRIDNGSQSVYLKEKTTYTRSY